MDETIKPCPFCGSFVLVQKDPLWHGSHGYPDCYEFFIRCPVCKCTLGYSGNNTIYNTEKESIENVIKTWNRRANESE